MIANWIMFFANSAMVALTVHTGYTLFVLEDFKSGVGPWFFAFAFVYFVVAFCIAGIKPRSKQDYDTTTVTYTFESDKTTTTYSTPEDKARKYNFWANVGMVVLCYCFAPLALVAWQVVWGIRIVKHSAKSTAVILAIVLIACAFALPFFGGYYIPFKREKAPEKPGEVRITVQGECADASHEHHFSVLLYNEENGTLGGQTQQYKNVTSGQKYTIVMTDDANRCLFQDMENCWILKGQGIFDVHDGEVVEIVIEIQ